MGVSVLDGRDLIYWKNKKIRDKKITSRRTLGKTKVVLNALIEFWNPDVLAVENVSFYAQAKNSDLLNKIVDKIEAVAEKKGVPIYSYDPPLVRNHICREIKTNKINTARVLATSHYPWLYEDYEKEKHKKFYETKPGLRVFDAIAVGFFCLHELENQLEIKK